MAKEKPSLPSGMRDFSPLEVKRRRKIFDVIRTTFERYGFEPIETPAIEKIQTLTGKYGDEGDKLLYRILNSGDYLAVLQTDPVLFATNEQPEILLRDYKRMSGYIAEKALRYDLTVPFARYVVMRRNDIVFPFKRYQIQTVWRADRPQKGRYREFMQCDADAVGSASLLYETEFIVIYDEVFSALGFEHFVIKLNHRKILAAIAEAIGAADKFMDVCTAIDKLDKIGWPGVETELVERGISEESIAKLKPFLEIHGEAPDVLGRLKELFEGNEIGLAGVTDMEKIFDALEAYSLQKATVEIDLTLARGLSYYTGTIFEVKIIGTGVGSVGGGGRYDDLTGALGVKNLSGVGISFGADRIYDVMLELERFDLEDTPITRVLFANFGPPYLTPTIWAAQNLRAAGFACDIYPEAATKINKQLTYANNRKIPIVAFIGENELSRNVIAVKNMESGDQVLVRPDALAETVSGFLSELNG